VSRAFALLVDHPLQGASPRVYPDNHLWDAVHGCLGLLAASRRL